MCAKHPIAARGLFYAAPREQGVAKAGRACDIASRIRT
jgi:hypothetical protein